MLIEHGGEPGSINHLGVEVFSSQEVIGASDYLTSVGLATRLEESTACCFAVQDKVWVDGVDGSPWEIYRVLEDIEKMSDVKGDGTCCTSLSDADAMKCC